MHARSRFVTLPPIVGPGSLPELAGFIADARIEAAGDGLHRCDLSDHCNAAVYPFGSVAFELFPQTRHVETLALFTRAAAPDRDPQSGEEPFAPR
jgi:hypothetical protein